jgi:hypothetical protein
MVYSIHHLQAKEISKYHHTLLWNVDREVIKSESAILARGHFR